MSLVGAFLTEAVTQGFHVGGYYARKGSLLSKTYNKYMSLSPAARFGIGLTEDIVSGYIATRGKDKDAFNTAKGIAVYGGVSSAMGLGIDSLLHHHGQEIKRHVVRADGSMRSARSIAKYAAVAGRKEIRGAVRKFNKLPSGSKMLKIAGIGAYLGVAMSGNANFKNTLLDAGIGAGAALGVGAVGAHMWQKHGPGVKDFIRRESRNLRDLKKPKALTMSDLEHRMKNIRDDFKEGHASQVVPTPTEKTVTPGEIEKHGIKVSEEPKGLFNVGKSLAKGEKAVSWLKFGGKLALGAIAIGGVMDVSNHLHRSREVDLQKASLEKQKEQQDSRDKQNVRQLFGYNYVNYGDIVTEMWSNRIGHYKMGNAKFN